jgi:hypothetical protein
MTKKDSNSHRKGKRNFQAFLSPSESDLIQEAKDTLKVKTDRELVVRASERVLDRQS